MKKISYILLVLVAASLSACAPAYYEASYHDHDEPYGRVSVHANDSYIVRDYQPVVGHHYGAIEVTLFADRTFVSANFHPIHLVIYDGDFVEIPVRNKRGILKKLYAHYYRGDLHFDSGRHCAGVHGSSRFKYDKRWDKGHRYDHVSAGPDFDLRGFGLIVRKHESVRGKHAVKSSGIQKNAKKHYENMPRNSTIKARVPKGKVYVSGTEPQKRHPDSRSVSVGVEKAKPTKHQVVVKERVLKEAVKVNDKKVANRKNKGVFKQLVERSNVVQSSKRQQDRGVVSASKPGRNMTVKAKKQLKNNYMPANGKQDNKLDVVYKKGKDEDKSVEVGDLVAVSRDERHGHAEKRVRASERIRDKRKNYK